ncbi:MAG: hypothetical protein K0U38_06035, partial [Epsilonproteobacteria bacterium]|nr:hypothetical protein [Campylobacterota bacterium]
MKTKNYFVVEFLTLYLLTPTLIYFIMPIPVLPFLWIVAFICYRLLLNDKTFDRNTLWNFSALKPHIKEILFSYIF